MNKKTNSKKSSKIDIFNSEGKKTGEKSAGKIDDIKVADTVLSQYVRVYLSRQRQGTSAAKKRSEVTGSGRKIYRQKGTGRARHGDKQAPIFVGGGVVHGPTPRDYSLKISKKIRKLALIGALKAKIEDNNVIIVQDFDKIQPKTKNFAALIESLGLSGAKRILFVYKYPEDTNAIYASRNIQSVDLSNIGNMNAYEIIRANKIIVSGSAEVFFTKLFDR